MVSLAETDATGGVVPAAACGATVEPAAAGGHAASLARRGVPIGLAALPSRTAIMSSSLGYWFISAKSKTRRAIGAAAAAPKPAFSTIIEMACFGAAAGASAM